MQFNVLDATEFLPDGHYIKHIFLVVAEYSRQFLFMSRNLVTMCGVNHEFATHTLQALPYRQSVSVFAANQR